MDKGKGTSGEAKKEEGKPPRSEFYPIVTRQSDRAHARTTRNDFPVGLTPPNLRFLFVYIYIYILEVGGVSPTGKSFGVVRACVRAVVA